MRAIHLICRREGISLQNLVQSKSEKGIYTSGCWVLHKQDDPQTLIGGWIYLHPISKNELSEFGGIIRSIGSCKREDTVIEDGICFVFEAKREGKGKQWRGASHGMAWTGGIVEATYPHEVQ